MKTKIYLNDSPIPNINASNFYLPLYERRRVMIAGTGEKCLVNKFTAKNIDLNKKNNKLNYLNGINNLNNTIDISINNINSDLFLEKKDCCSIY